MAGQSVEDILNRILSAHHIQVYFSEKAVEDFVSYDKGRQNMILAALIKKCQVNPLLRPDGTGESLHGELVGFAKVKMKNEGIRIVYRPRQVDKIIRVEVLVIGPRDKNKVYKLAVQRLEAFFEEMEERE